MRRNGVDCLLMGGQACVLYGAAEFSRDIDFAIHADSSNLRNLSGGLAELDAEVIAVPPFEAAYLERGHAVHFRCHADGVERLRVDVMSRMRGVAPFEELWARRTTLEADDVRIDALALPDLIAAKRTQRDKDWLMTNRLVEAHHARHATEATEARRRFWLGESFDLEFLARRTADHPDTARDMKRPVIQALRDGDGERAGELLEAQRKAIVEADRQYWSPLKRELEVLRRR